MAERGERVSGFAPLKKVEFPDGTPLTLEDLGLINRHPLAERGERRGRWWR
jgi:hypothetical protein